jgi:hypothetical protein
VVRVHGPVAALLCPRVVLKSRGSSDSRDPVLFRRRKGRHGHDKNGGGLSSLLSLSFTLALTRARTAAGRGERPLESRLLSTSRRSRKPLSRLGLSFATGKKHKSEFFTRTSPTGWRWCRLLKRRRDSSLSCSSTAETTVRVCNTEGRRRGRTTPTDSLSFALSLSLSLSLLYALPSALPSALPFRRF